jgi:hypothetical protein
MISRRAIAYIRQRNWAGVFIELAVVAIDAGKRP